MSADLLRQRRNLLVTSLVLVAINLAGATLKREVSVMGASLEFSHPERIVWGIWILWGYFLVRYCQYLNEENDLGIHKKMSEWIMARLPFDESDYEFNYWITWHYLFFWSLIFQEKRYAENDQWSTSQLGPQNLFIKTSWALQALCSVATKTPRFTDYVMPLLVALCPLILKAWDFLGPKLG
ncbi:hypothetical protein [Comamonas jiangduensis]|uniref:hypothetical protein n=1 Tax=Comamonas jiangduensis TaxID=1194168 RepID=UPI0028A92A75|nr:hypothetical protein [Comamonas jiangduensis]